MLNHVTDRKLMMQNKSYFSPEVKYLLDNQQVAYDTKQ